MLKNISDFEKAKNWFEGDSDFYAATQSAEFNALYFEVSGSEDADATEAGITKEMQTIGITNFSFEIE